MTPTEQHVARERAAALLGGLVRHGVRELGAVQAVPPLAEVLQEGASLEALGAAHHRVFSLEAPPVESFWLSPDRLLGGERSAAVAAAYRLGGFAPRVADVTPDHLGVQLAYLGWLAGARAHAVQDGRDDEDARIAVLERDFLDQHLLRWLPALVVAVAEVEPFFARVLELALSLATGLRSGLDGVVPAWSLPEVPDLDTPETSVRDIARVLCTPAHAGGLMTRAALARLGRADSLPAGFGDREQTLANLVRSAARFEALEGLWGRLDAEFARLGEAGGPWRQRCAETQATLGRMKVLADA